MLDCKEMNTSMVTNLKLLNDDSLERIDVTLYRHIIGSCMYLTNTRPYICFVVNTLSQYMVETRHVQLVATKHVMRYLKGTLDCGYTDSNWIGSIEYRKSTSGCCLSLGSGMISSLSRKNTNVALNTT